MSSSNSTAVPPINIIIVIIKFRLIVPMIKLSCHYNRTRLPASHPTTPIDRLEPDDVAEKNKIKVDPFREYTASIMRFC